jgi:hypothetical protein
MLMKRRSTTAYFLVTTKIPLGKNNFHFYDCVCPQLANKHCERKKTAKPLEI